MSATGGHLSSNLGTVELTIALHYAFDTPRDRIVWDATSLRADLRAIVLDLARDYHAATRIVAFACPPEWVAVRNKTRAHPVHSSVIEQQYERLQWPEAWEAHRVETIVAERA